MVRKKARIDFQYFAERFVAAYWQDVIDHPDPEPIEETLDELLATISWEVHQSEGNDLIIMRNDAGDVWNISFRKVKSGWSVVEFTATGHDLLVWPYEKHVRAMLDRVVNSALGLPE